MIPYASYFSAYYGKAEKDTEISCILLEIPPGVCLLILPLITYSLIEKVYDWTLVVCNTYNSQYVTNFKPKKTLCST